MPAMFEATTIRKQRVKRGTAFVCGKQTFDLPSL